MTSPEPIIRLEGIAVTQGRRRVLWDVSMAVFPGEIVTIVGPNGSGKTTLLRTILGSIRPETGRIERAPRLNIGYVPQRLDLDATLPLSVGGLLDLDPSASRKGIEAALDRVGGRDLIKTMIRDLSGGQLQRALLARAIMGSPGLLMLDEPTQGLDQAGSAGFYQLIDDIRGEIGCGVVMVSHELHVVMSASDRVICLNGHVCCDGKPDVVSRAPEYRALFGTNTGGALALYRHEHDHKHDHDHPHHPPAATDAHDAPDA